MIVNKLFLNNNHIKNPNGSLVKARNVIFDDDFEVLKPENGFLKLHTFTEDICGIMPTDVENIVFTTDGNGTDSIYRCTDNNATLLLKGDLSLSTDFPVKGEYQYSNNGDLLFVFNDTNNELRMFNADNPYMDLDPTTKEFIDIDEGINKLRLFPHFKTPVFTHDDSNPTLQGTLPKGTYHVILSYYIGEHDRLNWSLPSLPFIAYKSEWIKFYLLSRESNTSATITRKDQYFQDNAEEITNNSINLTISNLDTRYSRYKLGIIYRTETSVKAYDLGDFDTTTSKHTITKLSDVELSLDEVTIPYINVGVVQDITKSNDRLDTLGNKTANQIDYQKYANNIKVGYAVNNDNYYHVPDLPPDPFDLGDFKYINVRTPIWDEVYALNIGLVGKDGTVKGIYHIPGRSPRQYSVFTDTDLDVVNEDDPVSASHKENYNINGALNNMDVTAGIYYADSDIKVNIDYYYQLYNTADYYQGGYAKLAYWENRNESYPDKEDFQVWDVDSNGDGVQIDTLVGERVRHHKMPSLDMTRGYFLNEDNATKRSLKLEFTNIKFPKEILDEISGYFICFSDRTSDNSTVHGTYPMVRDNFYNIFPYGTLDTSLNETVKTLRFNNDSILAYKPAIPNPYLRSVYISEANLTQVNFPLPENPNVVRHFIPDTTDVKSYNTEIRKVTSYKYAPRDNAATDPTNKGREETMFVKVEIPYDDTTHDTMVVELKSDIDDVYKPFYNRRVSIASEFKPVSDGTYEYSVDSIKYLDGFISHHSGIHYRGDKTFQIDDDGTIAREGSDVQILDLIYYMNVSVVNSNLLSRDVVNVDIGDQGTNILGVPWTFYNGVSYTGTIISDPSQSFGITHKKYNSYTNNIVPYYTRDYNYKDVATHPFRVSMSAIQSKEALTFNWRYFSALNYYEMPKHRGNGISIQGIDKMLLIHMEHSLYIAQAKDKITIPDGDAYIGTSEIFDRIPDELIPTNHGTAGIQSRFGYCISELGYSFVDTYEKNIYLYGNNNINMMTNHANREFFKKYLNKSGGNPLNGNDIIFGVDHLHNRIIVTNIGDNPFTISYCYDSSSMDFISFHDYIPSLMVNNRLGSYSVNSANLKELYKFNEGAKNTYYDSIKYDAYIDVLIHDDKPQTDKILYSLNMMSGVYDDANNINQLFVYNRNQCSKIYDIDEMSIITDYDKARFLEGVWHYDVIRDYSSDDIVQSIVDDFGTINPTAINLTKNWYELGDIHGRFFIVRLITNNNNDMRFRDLGYNVSLNRR